MKFQSLATFVRKRDPRFKAFQEEEQKRKEAAAAEQKARIQREKQELQAQAAAYREQEWAKVSMEDHLPADEEDEDENDTQESDFYCVVCDKYYKSQQQFTSHESSKKHLKLAEALKQEMMEDEEAFDFGRNTVVSDQEQEPVLLKSKKKDKKNKKKMTPRWGFDDEGMDEDLSTLTAALELEQSRRRKKTDNINDIESPLETSTSADNTNEEIPATKTKREKRKEKKKAKEEAASGHKCNVCGNDFPTRNQLFNHIKETGHALAVPVKQGKNKRR